GVLRLVPVRGVAGTGDDTHGDVLVRVQNLVRDVAGEQAVDVGVRTDDVYRNRHPGGIGAHIPRLVLRARLLDGPAAAAGDGVDLEFMILRMPVRMLLLHDLDPVVRECSLLAATDDGG